MKFNEKLMELRKKEGLSQEELGEKLNVTRQTISKWELGQTTPEMEKLKEMSGLFHISVDELLSDYDIPSESEPIQTKETKKSKKGWIIAIIVIALILVIIYLVPFLMARGILKSMTGRNPEDLFNTFQKGTTLLTESLENELKENSEGKENLEEKGDSNITEEKDTIEQAASDIMKQAIEQYTEIKNKQTETKNKTNSNSNANTTSTQSDEINKQIEETKKKVEEQTKQHEEQYQKIKEEIEKKQKEIQSMIP